MPTDSRLAECVAEHVLFSLAKGGFSPGHDYSESSLKRKHSQAETAWDAMTQEQREDRLNEPLIPCECIELVIKKRRKTPVEVADENCRMCEGVGRRHLTDKEKDTVWWTTKQWVLRRQRETAGDGCCVNYVIESTLMNFKHGYWSPPLPTDGYVLDKSFHKVKGPMEIVNHEVKVYASRMDGGGLIETRVQDVEVPVREDPCTDENWQLVRRLVRERIRELKTTESEDEQVQQDVRHDLFCLKKVSDKLRVYGDAEYADGLIHETLRSDQWMQVRHLWMDDETIADEATETHSE
jgi:hypothetical protein